eukprot:TRINITY_DN32106_c0_g1_i1.p2 TRINITY_DN32106_c0_g1~~TRINITY_DN32106_c0_g1_i1.p2  ORF type:complete len:350 (+),score=110.71 TRINITY_DN32106_c0_g1_i1:56-1105(+)
MEGAEAWARAHRARLLRFYAHYAPHKVRDADAILVEWEGAEEELFSALVGKYGPEPAAPAGAAARAVREGNDALQRANEMLEARLLTAHAELARLRSRVCRSAQCSGTGAAAPPSPGPDQAPPERAGVLVFAPAEAAEAHLAELRRPAEIGEPELRPTLVSPDCPPRKAAAAAAGGPFCAVVDVTPAPHAGPHGAPAEELAAAGLCRRLRRAGLRTVLLCSESAALRCAELCACDAILRRQYPAGALLRVVQRLRRGAEGDARSAAATTDSSAADSSGAAAPSDSSAPPRSPQGSDRAAADVLLRQLRLLADSVGADQAQPEELLRLSGAALRMLGYSHRPDEAPPPCM